MTKEASHGFTALKIEGSILPSEFLQDVVALQAIKQQDADYDLSKSLTIKEELSRHWRIANDYYERYAERRDNFHQTSKADVNEWLVPFLRLILGYEDLTKTDSVELDDRIFKLTHSACEGSVPLLLVHKFDLDKPDPCFGRNGLRQTPHSMMQEYLNAEDGALWGIISNGSKLRILRDNPSLTRPSYIEVDLDLLFAEELYRDFSALWLTAHVSRLRPINDDPSSCIIESWRAKAHETGERVRKKLREGVTKSLRQIGNGFLQHPNLQKSLKQGTLSPEQYFQQLLRLVYRLLFLSVAEERNLLHTPNATNEQRNIFKEGYSISQLRERTLLRRHYDQNRDLWHGLQVTFRALAQGASDLGLPALGGLFRPDQCPDLDHATITNNYLLEAIHTLAFFRSGKSLTRINYRDMNTEELGSVYESLLELQPEIDVNTSPWTFTFSKGSEQKLTGSYYTPPSLVNELIKSTLDPVIKETVSSHSEDPCRAILNLRTIDPACGSGHFLLAIARRLATEIARIKSGTDTPNRATRQHAMREVVQHCIYGVDCNPLAVELCKTALWIEAVEPGKPLTFLDSHIVAGDSLVGLVDPEIMANGIPIDAYEPLKDEVLEGDDKVVCGNLKKRNRESTQQDLFNQDAVLEVAVARSELDDMPEETIDNVEHKRIAWNASQHDELHMREALRANLFMSAYFATKTPKTIEIVPITRDLRRLDSNMSQRDGVEELVQKLADTHRFLHWHLTFAEIMQNGGFDVVLGNPPWKRITLQDKEFFAPRKPEITNALNKTQRKRLIQQLNSNGASPAEKALYMDYEFAKRQANATSQYVHQTGGRFSLTGIGDVNRYALFAETFLQLVKPSGRAGLVVPTGIATDYSTKTFFNHIVMKQRLVSLFGFENKEKVFPTIGDQIKFCLLTLSGKDYSVPKPEFAFFLHKTEELKETERRFTLSAEDFSLFNPNTRTCPIFRTRRDMEIARKMYRRAGVLWKEARGSQPEQNPWSVSFQRMFDMSNDSDLFRNREELEEDGWELSGNVFVRDNKRYLPLYEAKLFHQYDHRFATFDGISEKDIKTGNARLITSKEKTNPGTVVIPRYWVPEEEVEKRLDIAEKNREVPMLGSDTTRHDTTRHDTTRHDTTRHTSHFVSSHEQRTDKQQSAPFFQNQLRAEQSSFDSGMASGTEANHKCNQSENDYRNTYYKRSTRSQRSNNLCPNWVLPIRKITCSTSGRTSITSVVTRVGMSDRAPLLRIRRAQTNALMIANMNSIVLDFAARTAVGGTDLGYFIIKQLPVLPPDAFLENFKAELTYADLIIPRVLELVYTADALRDFALELDYKGPPFLWNEDRRHCLKCELDAIFAHMYGLHRTELEWILDADPPSASFTVLKRNEINEFGEYRTQRYVLQAFDSLDHGEIPNLSSDTK